MQKSVTDTGDCSSKSLIAIWPYAVKKPEGNLDNTPLSSLVWPLGLPDCASGKTIGDMGGALHLVSFPRPWLFNRAISKTKVKLSLLIVEPSAFHWRYITLARIFHHRFYRVLTVNSKLLAAIPNGLKFPPCETWVPDWKHRSCKKDRMLSIIASSKRRLKGHRLRHRIVEHIRTYGPNADVVGSGYQPIDNKADGLEAYRYSIVIENSREPGYFTEKLIDALLLKTVPIYWGATDINRYFDTDGMLVCETEEDIHEAIRKISVEDYDSRRDAIDRNFTTAERCSSLLVRVAAALATDKDLTFEAR